MQGKSWTFFVSKSFRTDAGCLSICSTHSLGWRVLCPAIHMVLLTTYSPNGPVNANSTQ